MLSAGSIPEQFENQVEKYRYNIAIKDNGREYTYYEFNQMANRLARAIRSHSVEAAEPVALLLKQGILAILGIFAALKAGKFFVPLEPSHPYAGISHVLGDSQARLIITDSENLSLATKLADGEVQILNIDEVDPDLSSEDLDIYVSPDAIACITYTSGSTGQPKGVVSSHIGLLHHARSNADRMKLCANDRFAHLHSHTHYGSIKTILCPMLYGASVHPFNLKDSGLNELSNWLINEEITVYSSVSTAFRQLASLLTGKGNFPKLRVVQIGGEATYIRDVELLRQYFSPQCIMLHGFGASEAGSISCYSITKDTLLTDDLLSCGSLYNGMEVLILDEDNNRLEVGEVGEIAVRSQYLALGYWQRPELTKAKFLPDPEGGNKHIYLTGDLGYLTQEGYLFHLGRGDFQVKIRGHRIEITAVEMALMDHDAIKEAVAIAKPDRHGIQRLIAYIVPSGDSIPTITELRYFLGQFLPEHMIPSVFVTLDAMPLTVNGKTDRRVLPEPDGARPELEVPFVAPRTPVESQVAEIWRNILELGEVGIHDSFLELGGNSLLATQIISRIVNEFRVQISLDELLQSPTIADMALIITQNQAEEMESEDVERLLAELSTMSEKQVQELLMRHYWK